MRRGGSDGGHGRGVGGPDHEADLVPGIPGQPELDDAPVQRCAVLEAAVQEIGCPGVAAPRHQEDPVLGPRQERGHGVTAEERVHRHRIRAEHPEESVRIRHRCVPDVAALAVEDQQAVRGNARAQPLEDGVAGGAELLEEGEVGFDGCDALERRVKSLEAETLGCRRVREARGIEPHAEQRPSARDALVEPPGQRHRGYQTSREVLGWIAPWSGRGAYGSSMRSFAVAAQRGQTRAMRPSRMTADRRKIGVDSPQLSQGSRTAIEPDVTRRSGGERGGRVR